MLERARRRARCQRPLGRDQGGSHRDGSVVSADIVDFARASTDTFYRAAAESARRAVRTCSPFNELPADRYDIWQDAHP